MGVLMIEIDDSDLRRAMNHLARAMSEIETGKKMKREVSKHLRNLMRPLVQRRKTAVMALPSEGHSAPGGSMRSAIAKQIRASTRWSAKRGGVYIIQRARGMPRGFTYAGRAFNREEGWYPANLGGTTVHQQVRPAEWFDRQYDASEHAMIRREVIGALDDVAGKLADEIRRIR